MFEDAASDVAGRDNQPFVHAGAGHEDAFGVHEGGQLVFVSQDDRAQLAAPFRDGRPRSRHQGRPLALEVVPDQIRDVVVEISPHLEVRDLDTPPRGSTLVGAGGDGPAAGGRGDGGGGQGEGEEEMAVSGAGARHAGTDYDTEVRGRQGWVGGDRLTAGVHSAPVRDGPPTAPSTIGRYCGALSRRRTHRRTRSRSAPSPSEPSRKNSNRRRRF